MNHFVQNVRICAWKNVAEIFPLVTGFFSSRLELFCHELILSPYSTDYVDYADNESATSFDSHDIESERYNLIFQTQIHLTIMRGAVSLLFKLTGYQRRRRFQRKIINILHQKFSHLVLICKCIFR